MRLLIRNGTVVTAEGRRAADVLVVGETIAQVAEGITSFKLFMAYPGRLMVDDAAIFRTLLAIATNGGMVMMHAENGGVIEVLQERAGLWRDLSAVPLPHRRRIPRRWRTLHIETRMALLFDARRLPLERFVALTATEPARLFGLYPGKGTIAPGSDADLVIRDPECVRTISAATHHMRVDHNPFEGCVLEGGPEVVLLRGRPIVERGVFAGEAGTGRFLPRVPRQV